MGLERAHTEFVGQAEGLLVMGFGLLTLGRIVVQGHVAEESEDPRLVAALFTGTGNLQSAPGVVGSLPQTTGSPIHLAQPPASIIIAIE
jgi:hypothetical protein